MKEQKSKGKKAKISVDKQAGTEVRSEGTAIMPDTKEQNIMSLTLVRSKADRKSQRLVIYNIEGRKGSVQFLSTLFGGDQKSQGNPPETLVLEGEFAPVKEHVAKAKETPEERKARLAALPKLTLAEKVAKAEERTAKMKAKLLAQQAKQNAAQPEMATV